VPFPNFGTRPDLWTLLGDWVANELDLDWKESGGQNLHVILERFDELCFHLPRFGNPDGLWTFTVDKLAKEHGSDYVRSNVSQHYFVNGAFVQFFGRVGRVTVFAGT
jgi:hypothetical protein